MKITLKLVLTRLVRNGDFVVSGLGHQVRAKTMLQAGEWQCLCGGLLVEEGQEQSAQVPSGSTTVDGKVNPL